MIQIVFPFLLAPLVEVLWLCIDTSLSYETLCPRCPPNFNFMIATLTGVEDGEDNPVLVLYLCLEFFAVIPFVCWTQGDRFGGALDAAAKMFSKAFDSGIIPMEFVNKMKKEGKLIMGIGHRVKSVRKLHY